MAKVKCGTTRTGVVFCSKNRTEKGKGSGKRNKAYKDKKIKYSHRGTVPPRVARDRAEKMKPKIKKMTKKKSKTLMKEVVAKPTRIRQPGVVASVKVKKPKGAETSKEYKQRLGKAVKEMSDNERKMYNKLRTRESRARAKARSGKK